MKFFLCKHLNINIQTVFHIRLILKNCQHLNCNINTGETFTCDWCGNTGTLGGFGGDGIASGGDRG